MSDYNVDDAFKAMADEAQRAEDNRNSKKAYTSNFVQIKWTGLVQKEMKILRCLGTSPSLGYETKPATAYDARVVRIAKIADDKGKFMRVVLPESKDHLLWRIIQKVNEIKWTRKDDGTSEKTYLYKDKFADLYNTVNFNSLPESSNKRKFGLEGKGWDGRDYFLVNVIDRAKMDWHREHKHTMLLSKNVNVQKNADGSVTEFVEEGVPAYGLTKTLAMRIFKSYGNWENYDIGLERTGQKDTPYFVINAVKHIEEVPDASKALVVTEKLSAEEAGWERYDLDKVFGVVSYTKLWNRLKTTIELIDAKLGTKFAAELKVKAEEEAAVRAAKNEAEAPEVTEETEEDAPIFNTVLHPEEEEEERRITPVVDGNKLPPAYDKLTKAEQDMIGNAVQTGANTWEIQYKTEEKTVKCPDCKNKSPKTFSTCPVCGVKFSF